MRGLRERDFGGGRVVGRARDEGLAARDGLAEDEERIMVCGRHDERERRAKRLGKGLEQVGETGELSNCEERGDGRRRLLMIVYEKPIDMP